MNENPTGGEQGYMAPDITPPVYEPPPAPEVDQPSKPKLNIAFFILGFVTPWLATAIVSGLFGLFGSGTFPALGVVGGALPFALIAAQLAAWLIGRSNGNNRLRSWGLGGVISVAVQVLAGLLFFGACLLNIGGLGTNLGLQ